MAWRYINPGYVHLLDAAAQATATQVTGNEYSKTGVGFTKASTDTGVSSAYFAEGDDFYAKCDMYYRHNSGYGNWVYFCVPTPTNSTGIYLGLNQRYLFTVNKVVNGAGAQLASVATSATAEVLKETTGLKLNALNSVWLHVKYGDNSAGYMEFRINDKYFYVGELSVTKSSTQTFRIGASYQMDGIVFSSIICSSEEINYKEQVVALPVSSTETAMSLQSDTYLADSAGQTLLQSVNVSALISQYGSDSKVTGIALVGNPAYRTGEQLSSLTAISKNGGVTTEHGTSNLSDASDTVIWQSVPVASDTTIADLQNIQLGWKAGE